MIRPRHPPRTFLRTFLCTCIDCTVHSDCQRSTSVSHDFFLSPKFIPRKSWMSTHLFTLIVIFTPCTLYAFTFYSTVSSETRDLSVTSSQQYYQFIPCEDVPRAITLLVFLSCRIASHYAVFKEQFLQIL